MEIAFFDFCNTLVKINTLSHFVDFVINDKRTSHINLRKWIFEKRGLLSMLRIYSSRKIEIKCLYGIRRELLEEYAEEYYRKVISVNYNHGVVNKLYELKNKGFKIIVISAALDIYLKYIPEALPVDFVISSELAFNNDKCLGKILGIDSMGIGKIEKLKMVYDKYQDIKFNKSYFFSDGLEDVPLLKIVGNPFFVIKEDKREPSPRVINQLKAIKNLKIISPQTGDIIGALQQLIT
jgi:HAD-superfamily subfamily IB hydrolase, TIGR01490